MGNWLRGDSKLPVTPQAVLAISLPGEAGEEDLPELEILDSEVEREVEEPEAAAEEPRGEQSDTSSSSDSSSSELRPRI